MGRLGFSKQAQNLPVEDMERLGVIPEELASLEDGHRLTLNQRELLETQAQRAEQYYQSGLALLPLIAADSRPASIRTHPAK